MLNKSTSTGWRWMRKRLATSPTLTLTIPGEPRGKGRPRFTRSGHVYTDTATREYEDHVCSCTAHAMRYEDGPFPLNCPVGLDLQFHMHQPKHPRFAVPAVRPDLDNLVKSCVDGMGLARLFVDDARIVDISARKLYSPTPGVLVRVWER